MVLLFALLPSAFCADTTPEEIFPAGLVRFDAAGPAQVLLIYTELSGMQLVTSSHVNAVTAKITLQSRVALKKSEVLKLLEKALLDQAGIVVTKLDDKRASVTYNDALTVTAVTDGKPIQPPSFVPPPPKPIQK